MKYITSVVFVVILAASFSLGMPVPENSVISTDTTTSPSGDPGMYYGQLWASSI